MDSRDNTAHGPVFGVVLNVFRVQAAVAIWHQGAEKSEECYQLVLKTDWKPWSTFAEIHCLDLAGPPCFQTSFSSWTWAVEIFSSLLFLFSTTIVVLVRFLCTNKLFYLIHIHFLLKLGGRSSEKDDNTSCALPPALKSSKDLDRGLFH